MKYQSHVTLLREPWLHSCLHDQDGVTNYFQDMILKSKLQDFSTLNIKALLHNIIALFHNHLSNFLQLLSLNNLRCAVISWMTHETVPPFGIPAAGASLPAPLHFAKLSLLSCLWIWTSPLSGKCLHEGLWKPS